MVRNRCGSPWPPTLAVALLAALPGAATHAQPVPPDFEVTLTSAPRRPGGPPPESVTIRADGSASVSARVTDGRPAPAKTARVDAGAPAALFRLIEQERFFELKPLYRDDAIQDGDYAVLRVTSGGRTHEVRTVNRAVKAFDRIAIRVNGHFERGDMVLYNALLGAYGDGIER